MKKKSRAWILIVTIIFLFFMFCGATMFSGKTRLIIQDQSKKLLDKEYKIKTSTLMNVIFKNKADFYEFYKSNSQNQHVRNFTCINDEMLFDIQNVIKSVEYDSIDSQLIWDKSKAEFEIVEGKNGKKVDQNKLIENLYINFGKETRIDLNAEEIPQTITKKELERYCKERGRFSTNYRTSSLNRKHNIKVAAQRLNGMQIASGQTLSFNNIVGRRTIDNGYKMSRIISDGAFVAGVGGGVCQVSTTLFNAWVRADLEVIKAKNHSLRVSYAPPSTDAMVSNKTDLLLKNNSKTDVFIKTITQNDNINIIIYGYELDKKIELRNEIVRIIPCDEYTEVDMEIDWKEGEKTRILSQPKNGLVSNGYKDVYKDGKLVSSTKIRTNTYLPQKGRMVKRVIEEEKEQEKEKILKLGYFNAFSRISY